MEYYPPPFFKQGPSALAKLVFFALLAIVLLVSDARWSTLKLVRQAAGVVLYPVQRMALAPVDLLASIGEFFTTNASARSEADALRRINIALGQSNATAQQLSAENARLRAMLGLVQQQAVRTIAAEILYEARDPFARRVVIGRGALGGLAGGEPVIDEAGVLGQVTRVYPFTAEVTLLTDKDQAIPVQVVRTGLRAVAYGNSAGGLDLRFMATHADVVVGDELITSGLDGVYPAGLAVAKVTRVERNTTDAFARIVCLPVAGIGQFRHVLIMVTPPPAAAGAPPATPATPATPAAAPASKGKN